MSDLVCVLEDLIEVVWIQRIEDIVEVLAARSLVRWEDVREVLTERRIVLELGPQVLNGELIVGERMDLLDECLLEEQLLVREHQLEEVLIDLILRGQVVAQMPIWSST